MPKNKDIHRGGKFQPRVYLGFLCIHSAYGALLRGGYIGGVNRPILTPFFMIFDDSSPTTYPETGANPYKIKKYHMHGKSQPCSSHIAQFFVFVFNRDFLYFPPWATLGPPASTGRPPVRPSVEQTKSISSLDKEYIKFRQGVYQV